MKIWYPNTAQWGVVWLAAIGLFLEGLPDFFPLLGCYDADGRWLWPGIIRYNLHWHEVRLVSTVICMAILLVWQFARPVSIRSPLLIPVAFILLCIGWFVVGSIQQAHRARQVASFTDVEQETVPQPPPGYALDPTPTKPRRSDHTQ
jgi:hypothetical protein